MINSQILKILKLKIEIFLRNLLAIQDKSSIASAPCADMFTNAVGTTDSDGFAGLTGIIVELMSLSYCL